MAGALLSDQADISRVANDASSIDVYLFRRLRYLEARYLESGRPQLLLWAAESFYKDLRQIPACRSSFQYAMLLAFMTRMLVSQGGNIPALEQAETYAEEATDILNRHGIVSQEVIALHASLALHLGVIRKALGRFDDSILGMRAARKTLSAGLGAEEVELVMLRRQEVIMQQEVLGHRMLIEEAGAYASSRPMEYFSTIKRVFEFAMNKRMHSDARQIFPVFRSAFGAVARRLPALSHVSFAKNVGQFLSVRGESAKAMLILDQATSHARALGLIGQERQLQVLRDDVISGKKRGLPTFRVDKM
ncbi:MAG: hypothetical protein WDM94_01330 [Bauldia sp.]